MKARIEPVQERKVTVEMTESEAKIIRKYLGKTTGNNLQKFIDDYLPDFSYRELNASVRDLFHALGSIS